LTVAVGKAKVGVGVMLGVSVIVGVNVIVGVSVNVKVGLGVNVEVAIAVAALDGVEVQDAAVADAACSALITPGKLQEDRSTIPIRMKKSLFFMAVFYR
jgi:hypothetical protein